MSWRNIQGDILASSENLDDTSPDRFVLYPVHMLSNLLLDRVREQPLVSVHFLHPVAGVGQDENSVWADIERPDGKMRFSSDFVVGCDGANSIVRKSLFGDENFPGFTWDKQLVVTNVRIPSRYIPKSYLGEAGDWDMRHNF